MRHIQGFNHKNLELLREKGTTATTESELAGWPLYGAH